MAKLIDIWRTDQPVNLTKRQMPLIVDRHLTMIMDLNNLGYICESPLVRGKQLDEFTKKLDILSKEEIKTSFEVPHKDMLEILRQTVPCIGCRRSVERLFYDVMTSGHQALEPLIITEEGMITLADEVLESPRLLCTMLQGHSARLNMLLEKQPRNKTSRRCVLHSLEVQRARPVTGVWREAWDVMTALCRQELTLIDNETLETTLDTYLRKHRFCSECRTKVLVASSLLTSEPDPTIEKGYVPALYAGIKKCIPEHHVHLPTNTDYVCSLIERAQPEVMGRERHAKTLEIAQEEVLTCLGICVADKLYRVHRRLKEEETVCKVFAAVAIDALARNFQMAVEVKQGVTQLELLYEELEREEIVKQQRREKLRLKRKKKKERRHENAEEKENTCDCEEDRNEDDSETPCDCNDTEPAIQNNDRQKLQVLDPKIKGQPTCKCPDCLKKLKILIRETASSSSSFRQKKIEDDEAHLEQKDNNEDDNEIKDSEENVKLSQDETCTCCVGFYHKGKHDLLKWMGVNKTGETASRASSEPSSQDCGYSSGHNVSSSSMPSTPEGSEVACSEACCGREGECPDTRLPDKLDHSVSSIFSLREPGTGPSLTQMLQDWHSSEDEGTESYIPAEEVQEFKARVCQLHEKRLELRKNLKYRFAMLCSHSKPFGIPH